MIAVLCIPVMLASLALAGWLLQVEALKRAWLPSVTMNPTTASCFLLLSAGIVACRSSRRHVRYIGFFLLASAGMAGVLKLLDIMAGTRFGIDALLFHTQLQLQSGGPSRMAPNAAFCFVLAGAALALLMGRRREIAVAQVLSLVMAVPPCLALLGYLYGVPKLYRVSLFIPMALPTAISFLALFVYVVGATGNQALMAPLRDRGPGGRTARLLMPMGVIGPVLAGWLRLLGERAGLFGLELGVAIMVTVNILTFTLLIWWNARQLLRSEQKRRLAEQELAHAATHDFLTGLANRALFMQRLVGRLAAYRRRSTELFGVIYLDVDGFKQVNDRLGHNVGDDMLRQIATVLHACVRTEDLVARMGGDEFTILLDRIEARDDIDHLAARIFAGVPRFMGPPGQQVPTGVSLGIVIVDSRHASAESLLQDADRALYNAKRAGKGRASFFEISPA